MVPCVCCIFCVAIAPERSDDSDREPVDVTGFLITDFGTSAAAFFGMAHAAALSVSVLMAALLQCSCAC
ncbi:hypothetical protein ACHAXM_011197 [Skeletonema potamos]